MLIGRCSLPLAVPDAVVDDDGAVAVAVAVAAVAAAAVVAVAAAEARLAVPRCAAGWSDTSKGLIAAVAALAEMLADSGLRQSADGSCLGDTRREIVAVAGRDKVEVYPGASRRPDVGDRVDSANMHTWVVEAVLGRVCPCVADVAGVAATAAAAARDWNWCGGDVTASMLVGIHLAEE